LEADVDKEDEDEDEDEVDEVDEMGRFSASSYCVQKSVLTYVGS
jgi:hypothetical protein